MSIELYGSNLILCIYFIWFVIYFCFFCLWVSACVHVTWCDNSTLWCVAISRICNVYAVRKSTVNWQQRILCQKGKNMLDSVVYFYLKFEWLERCRIIYIFYAKTNLHPKMEPLRRFTLFKLRCETNKPKQKKERRRQDTLCRIDVFSNHARFSS